MTVLSKHKLLILVLLIASLAVFFRTYRYFDRIALVADNSRDAQVATYAKDNLRIPLTGNFSSAGPFFYGPWWYWFLEISSFLPFGNLTLWYVSTVLSLAFVALIAKVAHDFGGKLLSAIAALFAAISTLQVDNSLSIWNPSAIPVLAILALYFAGKSLANQKPLNFLLLGFFVGLASTIHLQGVLSTPLILVTIFLVYLKSKNLPKILLFLFLAFLGFLIPFTPLIYFDVNNYFLNSIRFLVYFFVDQYKIWVPNRWLIYIFDFWPKTFVQIIGGYQVISALLVILITSTVFIKLKNIKKHLPFFLIAATLVLELLIFRYYRGERHTYITLFMHPLIILLSAWAVAETIRKMRYVGLLLLAIITLTTALQTVSILKPTRITYAMLSNFKNQIYTANPGQNFDVWHCPYNGTLIGHPVGYFIYKDGREDANGVKVGLCEGVGTLNWARIKDEDVMDGKNWIHVSTQDVYRSTTEWWKLRPPQKPGGGLFKFIIENRFGR